jgi:hypothetical protein
LTRRGPVWTVDNIVNKAARFYDPLVGPFRLGKRASWNAHVETTVGATGVSRHTAAPIDTRALPLPAALAPRYDCTAIAQQDFSQVKNAPTTIPSATVATAKSATGTSYQYGDVSGIVYPQAQFELHLPTTTFSGRYLQEGCGGYCGNATRLS